jgi:hypothetical protein
MNINEIIENYRNKSKSPSSMIIKIQKNNDLRTELIKSTSFLDEVYADPSIGQRIFHVYFNKYEIIKCRYCDRSTEFNIKNRFSVEENKKDSNYEQYCRNLVCYIKVFFENLKGDQGASCLITKLGENNELNSELMEKTAFLEKYYNQPTIAQRFYHIWFCKDDILRCECGDPLVFSRFNSFSRDDIKSDSNYTKTCGKLSCKSKSGYTSTLKTLEIKYGVNNIWDIDGFRENIKKGNLEKYGVEYYTQSSEFRKKTNETYKKNWGEGHPTQFKEVIDKRRNTNRQKYGHDCALQNADIREKSIKSSYRRKEFILPSGERIYLQGYEIGAIKILLEEFDEKDIATGKKLIKETGEFNYNHHGKERFYFPDFYIRSEKIVIEVKSEYTYQSMIEENLLKRDSVLSKGYQFNFWIMDKEKLLRIE